MALAGGVLMIASGYASRGLLFIAAGFAAEEVPSYLAGPTEGVAALAITVLQVMIALGGVTVLLGGIALMRGRRSTGRTLILLGGGAGFLGVLVSFAFAAYRLGLGPAADLWVYWAGLTLAVGARRIAKGM